MLGGGRYDGLIENLGGPATPAVGWAAGIERLAMLVGRGQRARTDYVLLPIGEQAEFYCAGLIAQTSPQGLFRDMAFKGNVKKRYAES